MKRFIIVNVMLLLQGLCFGQVNKTDLTYYKSVQGIVFNQHELDSLVSLHNERAIEKGFDELTMEPKIIEEFKSGDTVYKVFKMIGVNKALAARGARFIGQKLSDFSFKDINGKNISLPELKGKPMVINFWFTSCAPCVAEIPGLNEMKTKYDSSVNFLAITYEDQQTVSNFLKKIPFNFKMVAGQQEFAEQYAIGYPTTLFINKEGIITGRMGGGNGVDLNEKEFLTQLKTAFE
jgi:cytochrome c biogenesis protein CcmG/thiol:disulfide interchange protein DsbE